MKPFAVARPKSRDELMALFTYDPESRIMGGGIDLLDLAKSGVSTPPTLVDVRHLPDMCVVGGGIDGSKPARQSLTLGGGVTLATVASAKWIEEKAPALSDAASMAATPQIRNVATLAGNLLQHPRCAYFRDPFFDCLKRGGKTCPALDGDHSEGAIFGNAQCCSVHPSNLAVALVAVGASVLLGRMEMAVPAEGKEEKGAGRGWGESWKDLATQFFATSDWFAHHQARVGPHHLIETIAVPYSPASAYVEVDQKQSFDWASASAAVALEMEGGKVKAARVALGHVAPVPLLSEAAAKALVGKVPDEAAAKAAGEAAVEGATPLRDNGHKVQHLKVCVRRAVLKAAARGGK